MNNISGFPELSIKEQIIFEKIKRGIIEIYELYGFNPFESRLVEDLDVIKEKGIDSKEIFILNLLSKGEIKEIKENEQKLALRFDLTVPFARYIGQNYKNLAFPLKRWQIQKVYRGETSRENLGRYCEFYQADIDVIGKNELSLIYDAEFPIIIYNIFTKVFRINKFIIRINNKKLLEGLFQEFGIKDASILRNAVKIIDNIDKVSQEETINNLTLLNLTVENANNIFVFFNLCKNSKPSIAIKSLSKLNIKNTLLQQGIQELAQVVQNLIQNIPEENFMIDPSIARGLDYYTGTIYETILADYKHIGSVCSGGRYENLVGTLSKDDNIKFPGCGMSIGLSRIFPIVSQNTNMTIGSVLIAVQDNKYIEKYNSIANMLRQTGIPTSVNYNGGRLKLQIEYAVKNNFKFLLIGKEELDDNKIQVKELNSGKNNCLIDISSLVEYLFSLMTIKNNNDNQQEIFIKEFLNLTETELTENLQSIF